MRILSFFAAFLLPLATSAQNYKAWSEYGGTADSSQYSTLKQINKSNVTKLQVAWKYATGDNGKYAFSPLVAGGRMYVLTKGTSVTALDPATGKELWTWSDPGTKVITNRGINYWQSADGSEQRLLFCTDHALRAVDARTGKSIEAFGTNGKVDLKQGLDRDPATLRLVQSLSPGRVFENLIILGSSTNQGYGSAPGDIRAFDVRTGKLVWTFHTVPRPGEFGYDTWPKDAWKKVGGANVWGDMSIDLKRGILFAPTASAKYNFYGVDRTGANLFADSLLALDARTGKRIWHYQMVHHDIWDYDGATAPKLLTVTQNGKRIDVVAQVSKQGFLWVFHRETGKPLWPIEERPVPKSEMRGEEVSKTQPFPTKPPPFSRQSFNADDLNPYISAEDRAKFRDQILSARNEGLFTPPGTRPTVQMPGNNGGANWGGAAVEPEAGLLYVVSKDLPCLLKLDKDPEQDKLLAASAGVDHYYAPFGFMVASNGLSAIAPPWTSLTAYDLNDGSIRWKIPLGEVPFLAAKGIRNTGVHYPKVGPVVTSTGLIFTGTRDKKVRALDSSTGKVLWEYELDTALEGIPAMYEVNGRQYIVFCAGAQVGLTPSTQEKINGSYVAFALPEPADQQARARAADYFPPSDAKGGWRTLTDAAQIRKQTGIDKKKLDEAFDYVQKTSQHGGLLVVRHGYLVYERYFGRGNREALPELASCGKAFTSIATGIMLREHKSKVPDGLDTKVYSPKYLPGQYFPVDDPRKNEITLGQVLSMSAGLRGTNPVYVKGVRQTWDNPTADNGPWSTTDDFAMKQTLWCAPGECYSYSTSSSHIPAMMVRKVTGMEMEDYLRKRLTEPLGFGTWGYAMYRPKLKSGIDENGRMLHTPGGGSIAVRSTDVLRFAYMLLHEGKWGGQQVVPADFVRLCGRSVKYNPHYTHSFNFNVNDDGHVDSVPRDAFWKAGAGGYSIYVVPSLDMVIYKMGGAENQYDPALTRLPVRYTYDGSRADWKAPNAKDIGDSTMRTLQMVIASLQQ